MEDGRWPGGSDYEDALWSPKWAFLTHELKEAEFEPHPANPNSLIRASGGFAAVAKARFGGQAWALRCLTGDQGDIVRRYHEIISILAGIPDHSLEARVFKDEIRVDESGKRFPVIAIEWFDGASLGDFVVGLCETEDLGGLGELRSAMRAASRALASQNIVHGDISADNILVRRTDNGLQIKFIDYDSMWAAGTPLEEFPNHVGLGPLKHSGAPGHLDESSDVAGFLIIDLVLGVLASEPGLGRNVEAFDRGRFVCSVRDIEDGVGPIHDVALREMPDDLDFIRGLLQGEYSDLQSLPWCANTASVQWSVFDAAAYVGCATSDVLRRCSTLWPDQVWGPDSGLTNDQWLELTGESASRVSWEYLSDLSSTPRWLIGLILEESGHCRDLISQPDVSGDDVERALLTLFEWTGNHTTAELKNAWSQIPGFDGGDVELVCGLVGVDPADLNLGLVSPVQWEALLSLGYEFVEAESESDVVEIAVDMGWPLSPALIAASLAVGRPVRGATVLEKDEASAVEKVLDQWCTDHSVAIRDFVSDRGGQRELKEAIVGVGLSDSLAESGHVSPRQLETILRYASTVRKCRSAPIQRMADTPGEQAHGGSEVVSSPVTVESESRRLGCPIEHAVVAAQHAGLGVVEADRLLNSQETERLREKVLQWRSIHSITSLRRAFPRTPDALLLRVSADLGFSLGRLTAGDLTTAEFEQLVDGVSRAKRKRSK